MRYTLTFVENDYKKLVDHLFSLKDVEQAAYLLCGMSTTDAETRLLVREVVPVDHEDIEYQDAIMMKIKSRSYMRSLKAAHERKECFIFVHSHPTGLEGFSPTDDIEERDLFKTAYTRISGKGIHGSVVFPIAEKPIGRVWFNDGTSTPIDLTRIIGNTFRFIFNKKLHEVPFHFFDRQIMAFGKDIQLLLNNLKIGIVGTGGTGSAVAEQLIRLGVGHLLIFDGDTFDSSNINRVYGSYVTDESLPKVNIVERNANQIGLNTKIIPFKKHIVYISSFASLRDCDIVFGCTDDELGRSILTRLAVYYYIPVFDLGVAIDQLDDNETIRSINGRVTTLIPSSACLFCRGRITSEKLLAEVLSIFNPEEYKARQKDGYVIGLNDPAPAVIPLTTAVASSAVLELIHRLTACLGKDRESTELLHLFDITRIRTNKTPPVKGCFCNDRNKLGKGDIQPFLDMVWPQE